MYAGHLQRPGLELPYDDETGLREEELDKPAEDGLVRVAHYQPERTHNVGYDSEGMVTDWVGVWRH